MRIKHNEKHFFITKKDIFFVVEQTVNSSNDTTVIIPNAIGLNNTGNSKFSNILYRKFPAVKDNIDLSNKQKLGNTQYINLQTNEYKNQIVCVNMFCKHQTGKYDRVLDYGALSSCMLQVRSQARNLMSTTDKKVQIHSPKFGTGFAGGDWRTISNLINDIWARDFTCFIYEPANA
jgi:hypothetical protein